MKNLWGLVIKALIMLTVFSSCKNDDEAVNSTNADINTIENDEQFIDFVKQTFNLADQMTDYARIQELNQKLEDETISESELSELATLLGFTNWTAVEEYALERYEVYETLENKYGFTNENMQILTDKSLEVFDVLFFGTNKSSSSMKIGDFDCELLDGVSNCNRKYIDCVRSSVILELEYYDQYCTNITADERQCSPVSNLGSFFIQRSYTQAQCLRFFHCCLLEFGGCAEQDQLSNLCRATRGPSFNF